MKILIITTGGTIEGLDYDTEQSKPQFVNTKIKEFIESANVSFDFVVDDAFNKDSRFITSEDRNVLLQKIESSDVKEVLITHGTITMVETARFLGELNIDKTIVLVGSFISGNANNTDAPFNLGYAICALQTLGKGVYIAINGKIFTWNNVIKNTKDNRFEYLEN